VCRKLDGIPLAIELAAARMTVLAVDQVAERLENSLKLLTAGDRTADPRHQTLRATLEWSHELLDEPERILFRWLSVFAGAGPWRQRKGCALVRASGETRCWTCCPGWWRSRWWWSRRGKRGRRASGCWSPSGSTATNV